MGCVSRTLSCFYHRYHPVAWRGWGETCQCPLSHLPRPPSDDISTFVKPVKTHIYTRLYNVVVVVVVKSKQIGSLIDSW